MQPGKGGWGILSRDTNGTPSILVGLGVANPAFAREGILVNSVPNQYLVRMGAVMPIRETAWA